MKYSDIEKIHGAGLITDEQRDRIVGHFELKEQGSRSLTITTLIAAALVACGIVLLISANWQQIPRGLKIAGGLLLMLGAHGGGWYLREVRGSHVKTGEALHILGSLLFLANIALLGQVYHLVSRPPNALMLWCVGIAAFPFLLRSAAHFLLLLVGLGFWFGLELNQHGSWLSTGDQEQLLMYAALGLLYLGAGSALRVTRFHSFSKAGENLGLLLLLVCAYPLTWGGVLRLRGDPGDLIVFSPLCALGLALLGIGLGRGSELPVQWRWCWAGALLGLAALMGGAFLAGGDSAGYPFYHWVASVGLAAFALVQVQVGLHERAPFKVNLGVVYVALVIIAAYLSLFGTMAFTGLMFVVSGVLLFGLGVYFESKRRRLVLQLKTRP